MQRLKKNFSAPYKTSCLIQQEEALEGVEKLIKQIIVNLVSRKLSLPVLKSNKMDYRVLIQYYIKINEILSLNDDAEYFFHFVLAANLLTFFANLSASLTPD